MPFLTLNHGLTIIFMFFGYIDFSIKKIAFAQYCII